MDYGAIDLHKVRSQIRIVDAAGAVRYEGRVLTGRTELIAACGEHGRLRILLESGTESEWVAQALEAAGHEVIVADPNYLPMYGARSRKIKTDRRDVAALAEACRTGVYRRAHRVSAAARARRQTLRVRQQLVRARSGALSVLRALLRQEGIRLPMGSAERALDRLAKLALPAVLATRLEPLGAVLRTLNTEIAAADQAATADAAADPTATRLMSVPGVGPIVALTFCAVLDDPARFGGDAARASAYLGLVPREDSSAERRLKGHITKSGPGDLRALLVQASWACWRSRAPEAVALQHWATALAARRGRRIAVVALARRLSRILYALWRDQAVFQVRGVRVTAASA